MNLTLTVDLPDQDRDVVLQIDDLEARVAWFVSEQIALERWRRERHEPSDRSMALDAIREAAELKVKGASRDEVAKRFLNCWEQITDQGTA